MSKLLEDEDYDSEEDEDYAPTAQEEEKAEAELKEFGVESQEFEDDKDDDRPYFDPDVMKKWEEIIEASRKCDNLFAAVETEDELVNDGVSGDVQVDDVTRGTKRKIIETFDFYGESVTKEREVDEKEAKRIDDRKSKTSNKRSSTVKICGMDTLMKKIEKNPKMTVVDKSQLDWQRHIKKQKLEEELTKYDRSKDSYLDNAAFSSRG